MRRWSLDVNNFAVREVMKTINLRKKNFTLFYFKGEWQLNDMNWLTYIEIVPGYG